MKKHLLWLSFLLVLCLLFCVMSCSRDGGTESVETTALSVAISTVKSNPTSTPIPTYAPGTELYGMLSITGEVVIDPKYEYLDLFSDDGLARFEDHGLWGFVDERGIEVIEAQYEYALSFSDGLAAVEVDGVYGFIDETGAMVIEPQFEGALEKYTFGRCLISENGKLGIIDQAGLIIVEPQYKSIELYCENYFIVQTSEKKHGIIDRDGNVVVECQYSDIYAVTDSGYFFENGSDIEYCDLMLDFEGNYNYCYSFNNEHSLFKIHSDSMIEFSPDGELWGIIDLEDGTYILDPVYESVSYTPGDIYAQIDGQRLVDLSTDEPQILPQIPDRYDPVQYDYVVYSDANGKEGVMDIHGNPILPAEYQYIVCSPHGEFAIYMNNTGCIIDSKGNTLLSFPGYFFREYIKSIDCWVFCRISDIPTGEAGPEDAIVGFMKRDGTVFIEPEYDHYYANADSHNDSSNYPYPLDGSTSLTFIYDYDIVGAGKPVLMLVNTSGYVLDYPMYKYAWFPYKGVIVIVDKDGNEGLFTYDGNVLFEQCECSFPTTNVMDDSDYLIYTVKSK